MASFSLYAGYSTSNATRATATPQTSTNTQPHMMRENDLTNASIDSNNHNNEYTLLANASGGERR